MREGTRETPAARLTPNKASLALDSSDCLCCFSAPPTKRAHCDPTLCSMVERRRQAGGSVWHGGGETPARRGRHTRYLVKEPAKGVSKLDQTVTQD